MIVYKKFPFSSSMVEDIGEALRESHAVEIDNIWYFPIKAEYNQYRDVITFKLDQDLRAYI